MVLVAQLDWALRVVPMTDGGPRRVVIPGAGTRLSPADEKLRAALIDLAEANHAQYPQYRGTWDNWLLAEIAEDAFGKDGKLTAPEGTPVLLSPEPMEHFDMLVIFIPSGPLLGNHGVHPHMVRPRSPRDRAVDVPGR